MLKKSGKKNSVSHENKRLKKSVATDSESSDSDSSDNENQTNSSDSESSSSSDSSSSSQDEKKKETKYTTDIKIKKCNRLIQALSSELESAERKYGKIERALQKSTIDDDKLKKIKKYKTKYKTKIEKTKKRIDHVKIKLVELNKEKSQSSIQSTSIEQKKPSSVLKVPYPVLNDKRDMKIILSTLEKKMKELGQKKDINNRNLSHMDKNSVNYSKLLQLNQAMENQREKLSKQIEYLNLSLSLEAINKKPNQDPMTRQKAAKLTIKINDLFNYMKNENKNYLIQQQMSENERKTDSPIAGQIDPFDNKINGLYEQLNKALVAYLAHTAATAHYSAAVSAANYNYYYQNLPDEAKNKAVKVPLKTEIDNAFSKFGLLKEKISTFLTLSKMTENKNNEKKPKLIADYSDESENDTDDEDVQVEEKSEEESEDEDDLEIVMTSDLKSKHNERNYLLPSLKASYFPLKASLINLNIESDEQSDQNELIAVEQSKFGLAFLANAKTMTYSDNFLASSLNKRVNVKLSDILFSN